MPSLAVGRPNFFNLHGYLSFLLFYILAERR